MALLYAGRAEVTENGVILFTVTGEVDIFTSDRLKQELHGALNSSEGDMIIDLSHADFFDSTGLGVLVGVLRRLREAKRGLVLIINSRPISRVFTVTGLNKAFTVAESLEEAQQLLR